MKTHYLFSMFALLSMSLFSSAKKAKFESKDAKFIFSLKDIMNLDISGFKYEKLQNDKHYFYAKSDDDLNGVSYFYGEKLLNGNNRSIELTTSLSVQVNKKGAIKLYRASMMVPIINKADTIILDPHEYGIDEGSLSRIRNVHVINLRKDRLFYQIWIEGIELLEENQLKDNLVKKVGYLLEHQEVA